MRTRQAVAVVVILAFYLTLVGQRAILSLQSGDALAKLLGTVVLAAPLVGVWFVWRETRLDRATQRMAGELEAGGALPPREPRGEDGRQLDPERADMVFHARRMEVDAAPDDWASWYRLALAYDDAGDRSRSRAAMRHAIVLRARSR